ncbi:MAG TPA: hypothetical protein VGO09_05085 [Flavisolibacter sp.]|nr:hypothetical protein [Flavisolibacter sp.]
MELKMVISDKIIDTIAVDHDKFSTPGYLEQLRSELLEKHPEVEFPQKDLHFYVDNIPSSANKKQ